MLVVFRDHTKMLVAGVLLCVATFVLFYLMTVFSPCRGVHSALGFSREKFLLMQLFLCSSFFAATIPISSSPCGAWPASRPALDHHIDRGFWAGFGPYVRCGYHRGGGDDGARSVVDGSDLRTTRHGAFRTVSHTGALHGQLSLGRSTSPASWARRWRPTSPRGLPRPTVWNHVSAITSRHRRY